MFFFQQKFDIRSGGDDDGDNDGDHDDENVYRDNDHDEEDVNNDNIIQLLWNFKIT